MLKIFQNRSVLLLSVNWKLCQNICPTLYIPPWPHASAISACAMRWHLQLCLLPRPIAGVNWRPLNLENTWLLYLLYKSIIFVNTEDDVNISHLVHHLVGRLVSKSVIRDGTNFSSRIFKRIAGCFASKVFPDWALLIQHNYFLCRLLPRIVLTSAQVLRLTTHRWIHMT